MNLEKLAQLLIDSDNISMEETEKQIKNYQKAINIEQQPLWVYAILSYLHLKKGEINQGIETYQTAIKLYPNKKNWFKSKIEIIFFQQGINQLKQGKIETAITTFQTIDQINLYNELELIPWLEDNKIAWPYIKFNWISEIEKLKPKEIQWPKISIVTPSFNQGNYIEETILSVINQNYPNLEYIIVDNQSSDQTQHILTKYQDQVSKIIIEPDNGQSNAINKGFSHTTGELMTWLNSDDMLAPGALHIAAITYLKQKSDLIAGICIIHEDHKITNILKPRTRQHDFTPGNLANIGKLWCNGHYFRQPEVIFTRNIWNQIGGALNEELEYVMDYELWLQMAQNNVKLTVIAYPFAFFRSYANQKTANYQFNTLCMIEQLKVRNRFQTIEINEDRKKIIFDKLNTFINIKNKKILVIAHQETIINFNETNSKITYATTINNNTDINQYDVIIILILLKNELEIIKNIKKQGFNKLLIGWFWYNNCQYYDNAIIAEQLDLCVPANKFLADVLTNEYSLVTDSLPICSLIKEIPNHNTLAITKKEGFYIELPKYINNQTRKLIDNIKQVFPESTIITDDSNFNESEKILQRLSYQVSLCVPMANEIPPSLLTTLLCEQIPIITEDIWELETLISSELKHNLPVIQSTCNDILTIEKLYQDSIFNKHIKNVLSKEKLIILDNNLLPQKIDRILAICYHLVAKEQTIYQPMEDNKILDRCLEIGTSLIKKAKYEKAIALYEKALILYPDNINLYLQLGIAQEKNHNIQEAISNYQKAIQLEPQQPLELYTTLGHLLKKEEKWPELIALYQQAINIYPSEVQLDKELSLIQDKMVLVCGKYYTYPDLTGKRQAEGGLRLANHFKRSTPHKPLVSIITAVYNNLTSFERCINSVLNQKYDNIEYIIIDGGSDQPTLEIINKYQDRIDYFVSEPDGGIYNAMNKGIELAQGDYICVLNSDDWYSPDFVSSCVEVALSKGSSVVYTYCNHGPEQWITPGINKGIFLTHLNINHASFLVSKDCYNRIGKYSENYRIVSDMLWKCEAFKNGEQFDLVPDFLFNFSHGGLSSGQDQKRKELMFSEIISITKELFNFLEDEEALEIYKLRFDKNKVSRILEIAEKYKSEKLFISSLGKYLEYCFKYRDNFNLPHTDSNTCFPVFLKAAQRFSIPKSSLRIKTKYGCFSELIASIDEIWAKKKPNTKKVVLHYVFNFSTPSETFIYDLLTRLEDETVFDNYILFDNRKLEKERTYDKAIQVHWAGFREEIRNELYKYIFQKINPDVVICHFALNEWKLRERIEPLGISVPTINMTHGIDVFFMGDPNKQDYKKYILEDFCKRENTCFTTVSNYLRKELESQGVPKDKISLVHNTVNERFFAYRKQAHYFRKKRTLKLLNIGRLIDWKGHLNLLQGVKYFKDKCYKDVHLTIVYGYGKDYYQETVAEIEKLNLADHVSLISFVDFSKEPDFFQSFDIYIQSSTYTKDNLKKSETFGVAVLEAIASGLPVIVTDAGGLPEVVGYENRFAKIVPHGDGIAIGKALQEFFEQEDCFSDNIEYATERLAYFSGKKQTILLAKEIIRVSQGKLNAALFSSATIQGAGYAAFRVHKGLRFTSINPTIYTKGGQHRNYPNVKVVSNPTPNVNSWNAWNLLQENSLIKPELTIFSLNHPYLTSTQIAEMVKDADVISLHWVARFLSIENIAQLSKIGKPVLITIRDMHPLTGGCHYFHGCEEWQRECSNCPQLVDTFDDYPQKVLQAKRDYYNFDNITIVTISNHTAEIVKKTPYFNQCRLEVIINSLETDVFKPHDKIEARKKLGLPLDRKIIGYVPSFSSTVKGYKEVIAAFDILQQKYKDLNPFVMLLGDKTPVDEVIKFNNKSIGYIDDNNKLAVAYSAADVVIVPSLEETFSNTTAEAISCGTPVVGFKTGAIPDMAQDGITGYTYPIGDVQGLAEGIYKILTGPNLSQNCRQYAEKNLSFMIQARKYEQLFYELYTYNKMSTPANPASFPSYFTETTPTIMSLLVSKLLKK